MAHGEQKAVHRLKDKHHEISNFQQCGMFDQRSLISACAYAKDKCKDQVQNGCGPGFRKNECSSRGISQHL